MRSDVDSGQIGHMLVQITVNNTVSFVFCVKVHVFLLTFLICGDASYATIIVYADGILSSHDKSITSLSISLLSSSQDYNKRKEHKNKLQASNNSNNQEACDKYHTEIFHGMTLP